jgi:anaerobic C4-dicarboxylate transporter
MQTSRMVLLFSAVIISYLLTDCVKILLAKQLKNKMTPTNIFKIKKGISIVLIFGIVLITQGWFQKKRKWSAFENIEK